MRPLGHLHYTACLPPVHIFDYTGYPFLASLQCRLEKGLVHLVSRRRFPVHSHKTGHPASDGRCTASA